jgi:hypothetical protein
VNWRQTRKVIGATSAAPTDQATLSAWQWARLCVDDVQDDESPALPVADEDRAVLIGAGGAIAHQHNAATLTGR